MKKWCSIYRQRWHWPLTILCLWLASANPASAQRERVKRLPYADLKPYYLGFQVGVHAQDLRLSNSGFVTPEGTPLYAEIPEYRTGLSVGVMGGKVIIPGLELRLTPTLHFGEKPIAYSDGERKLTTINQRATYLSLPMMMKCCAMRLNNLRPYVGVGAYAAFGLGGRKEDVVRLRSLDYGLTVSIGCDLYLPYFKLSPELSFSQGFAEAIQSNRPELAEDKRLYYTQAIRSGRTRMIALTLHFQ